MNILNMLLHCKDVNLNIECRFSFVKGLIILSAPLTINMVLAKYLVSDKLTTAI